MVRFLKENIMTEKEMFEESFKRPKNYFKLPPITQCEIDKKLGILDWEGDNLTEDEMIRFKKHYYG